MGISLKAVRMRTMVINIENLKCTMLIGANVGNRLQQEIPTAFGLGMTRKFLGEAVFLPLGHLRT